MNPESRCLLATSLTYSSTLEEISSEITANLYGTTHHIPDDFFFNSFLNSGKEIMFLRAVIFVFQEVTLSLLV
jgi:hypothetical protein